MARGVLLEWTWVANLPAGESRRGVEGMVETKQRGGRVSATRIPPCVKAAMAKNQMTLEQMAALRSDEALRLPLVGSKVWAEIRRLASKRGGARIGAGVKAADGATGLVQIAVRVTQPQREKLGRLGGSVWVRRAIEEGEEI